MTDARDAYAVLQVQPTAEMDVIAAAYRALAKRYHPDGATPDAMRMTVLNAAWEHVRTHERRTRYDAERRRPVAVGPGRPPSYQPWAASVAVVRRADDTGSVLDFGQYAGWRVRDVARRDPDYLRWLSRHSSGIRYREAIARALPGDRDLGRADRAPAGYRP